MKLQNSFKMLTNEIRRTFNYKYEDAEKYANHLKKMCLIEYNRAYQEATVTKDK